MQGKISTPMLTRMAMLVTLNIILTRWLSIRVPMAGVEGIRIGFGELPVYFAGIFLGPMAGVIVGGVGDILGYFINPLGAYMPHFTLAAALRGAIPGLILALLSNGRKRKVGIIPLALALGVTMVSVNIFLVPYFIETLFGLSRVATVPPRIISTLMSVPIFTAMLIYLYPKMGNVFVLGPKQEGVQVSGSIW